MLQPLLGGYDEGKRWTRHGKENFGGTHGRVAFKMEYRGAYFGARSIYFESSIDAAYCAAAVGLRGASTVTMHKSAPADHGQPPLRELDAACHALGPA